MRPQYFKTIIYCSILIFAIVLGVQFYWLSHIKAIGTSQFTYWIIVSGLIILAASAMALTLFFIYRQKLWQEVQKEFVDNFIHEFKTPVSVINIAGNVLLAENISTQPERLKKYAGIMKDQAEQLQLKVSRILELALSDKKELELERAPTDVTLLIQEAIALVEPLSEEKKAIINYTPTPELQVVCDKSYVAQALVNILDNSLKYSFSPMIHIETGSDEKFCLISISDNGIGIDPKYHKEIFRKFYRVPTGNVHNVKGFGIGLNFVKKVIEAHGGRIELNSASGSGTKMKILIPIS